MFKNLFILILLSGCGQYKYIDRDYNKEKICIYSDGKNILSKTEYKYLKNIKNKKEMANYEEECRQPSFKDKSIYYSLYSFDILMWSLGGILASSIFWIWFVI